MENVNSSTEKEFSPQIQKIAILFLTVFATVRFGLEDVLYRYSNYGTYIFEGIFISSVWILFYRSGYRTVVFGKLKPRYIISIIPVGLAAYLAAKPLGLVIPFDLKSREVLLFILLIGPIIEELLFRMAIWELLGSFIKSYYRLLFVTSTIFSFAHLWAYWQVPSTLKSFVIYQAAYTFFLGAACGLTRLRSRGLLAPILVHMGFNLGFVLGAIL